MAIPLTVKVYKGDQLVATKEYDRDIIKIGRLASAHLCLDDEKVSRVHSVIEVGANGAISIVDMGSAEGTYLNGKRVNKGVVASGDEIRIGNTVIRIEPHPPGSAANLEEAALPQTAESAVQADSIGANPAVAVSPAQAAVAPPPESGVEAVSPAQVAVAPPPNSRLEATSPVPPAQRPREAPKPRVPRGTKGSGPLGLELRFLWGDQIVGEFLLRPDRSKPFTVGSAEGVDFSMGDAHLGGHRFEVIRADREGFHLRFTQKMNGELVRGGAPTTLKQLTETRQAAPDGEANTVLLQHGDFAWLDLGRVTLEVNFQPLPKPVFVPFFETVDFTALNIFLVMFFLAALFVITALNRELEGEGYKDELSTTQARIAKLIIKPPEIQKNPFLEKLAHQKENQGEMAAKHRGDEGQMGKKDGPKRNARAVPKGDPNDKDQARQMAQRIFGSGGGPISSVFGKGLGGELKSAMGNMFGTTTGDARGFGGLGLRGSGSGGGGTGDSVGIGGIGTKGRGGGVGSYGMGTGGLGTKKSSDVGISSSEPEVMGSLDKELIRRVIHANRNQIRYCYESQLTRFPKLAGKVTVKFVISAAGTVASSQVASSTAGNAELETCVAGRVHTWLFPKPKGGGVVIVTYPFIFKPSGE